MKDTIALGKLSQYMPKNISREHYAGVTQFFDIYGIEYIEDLDALKDDKSTYLTARRLPTHQPEWPQVMKLEWLISDVIKYESTDYVQEKMSLTQFLKEEYKNRVRENELEQAMLSRNLSDKEKEEYDILVGHDFCDDMYRKAFWDGVSTIRTESVIQKRKIVHRTTQREAARLIEEIKYMESMFSEKLESEDREFLINLLSNS